MKNQGKQNILSFIMAVGLSFSVALGQAAGAEESGGNNSRVRLNSLVSEQEWRKEFHLRKKIISRLSEHDRLSFYRLIALSGAPADMKERLGIFHYMMELIKPEMPWWERGYLFLWLKSLPLERRDEVMQYKAGNPPQQKKSFFDEEWDNYFYNMFLDFCCVGGAEDQNQNQ